MGFFDCRCMVTGVSLKGSDAALVLLQETAGQYVSISLAIKGNYDRLGSIDGVEEDANTKLVLRFFLNAMQTGKLGVDEECLPIQSIEDLLHPFERNMNECFGYADLHGQPVVFALISRTAWDTIAQAAPPSNDSISAVFHRLFQASPVASAIYAASMEEVSGHIAELAAMDAFLRKRGLHWKPTEAGGQDYPEEMRQYLAEARQAFADSTTIMEALRRYEEEVAELLEGE